MPLHPLQGRCRPQIGAKHKADSTTGFLLALIHPPLTDIEPLLQPKKTLKQVFHVLRRVIKLGCHFLVGGKNLQPTALPCLHYWYIALQPIPGFLVLAYHDSCPFDPIGTNKLGDEPPPPSGNATTSPPIARWIFIKFSLETWTST
jgi:hypothetical protein